METISVRNINVDVVRKDIKNVHLRVYPPNGFVRASVPKEMAQDAIRLFLVQKLSWYRKQQERFQQVERISPREFLQRESHYFLGQRYLLEVIEKSEKQRVIQKNIKTLQMVLRPQSPPEKALEIMDEFYRKELKTIVSKILPVWEGKLGVKVSDWQIKKMRTRWGTCNPEKIRILVNL